MIKNNVHVPHVQSTGYSAVLRALFISLSESRSLRAIAEKSAIGRRISTRFVAGTQVEDVLRATQAINQAGPTVSMRTSLTLRKRARVPHFITNSSTTLHDSA